MRLTFDSRALPLPGTAELASHEAEAWLAELDLELGTSEENISILSKDEVERASGMATIPRRRMIKTRVALRRVLSSYLGAEAGSIEFAYGARGKPRLAGEHASSGLHFNVSHTIDRAIIAVGGSPLGIDIESPRKIRDIDALAAHFFASGEILALRSLPASQREQAFRRCWTRKEAYAKALGGGIAMGLRSFEVAVTPNRGTALLGQDGRPDPHWTIRELYPEPGLVGTLAINQPDCLLWCWKVTPSERRSGRS